jgi:hypothetical protein
MGKRGKALHLGRDDNDLIEQQHTRKVNSFVCGGVETVTPAGGVSVAAVGRCRLSL